MTSDVFLWNRNKGLRLRTPLKVFEPHLDMTTQTGSAPPRCAGGLRGTVTNQGRHGGSLTVLELLVLEETLDLSIVRSWIVGCFG